MNIRILIVIIFLFFLTLKSYSQTDTLYITKVRRNLFQPNELRLTTNLKTTDRGGEFDESKINRYKNVKKLSINPKAVGFAYIRGSACIVRYAPSYSTELPSWIYQMKKLEELNLIGIDKIDFEKELYQLGKLSELRILYIDPIKFEDNFIDVLIKFQRLESLKIRAELTDEEIRMLKRKMPNCKITTGIYANY